MRGQVGLVLVAASTLAFGCGDDSGEAPTAAGAPPVGTSAPDETVAVPGESAPGAGAQVFYDGLDDDGNGWGVFDASAGSNSFEGGDYVWSFQTEQVRPHFLADSLLTAWEDDELNLRDVVVRGEGTVTEGEAALAVFCREVPDSDADFQWYEFVVGDGFAAIRRADDRGNLDVLEESDDLALAPGSPVAIEAACIDDADGDAQLWLTVDDELVLHAVDEDPLPSGLPGLQAYGEPDSENGEATVRWHEFSVWRSSGGGSAQRYCDLYVIFEGVGFPTDAQLEEWGEAAPDAIADEAAPVVDILQEEGVTALTGDLRDEVDALFATLEAAEAEAGLCVGDEG